MYPFENEKIKKNLKDAVWAAIFNIINSFPQYVKTGLFCAFVCTAIGFSVGLANDNWIAGLIIGSSTGIAFGLGCSLASNQYCRLRLILITGAIISGITAITVFLAGFGLLSCLICLLLLAVIFTLGCGLGTLIGPFK